MREGDRIFMVQRGQNLNGRFLKQIEYCMGTGNGILVILEGQNDILVRELDGSTSYVSNCDNRIASS